MGSLMQGIITDINSVMATYVGVFTNFGSSLVAFILGLEIIKSAFNLATGRGFDLDKKVLVTFVFVGLFVFNYGNIHSYAIQHGNNVVNAMNASNTSLTIETIKQMGNYENLWLAKRVEGDNDSPSWYEVGRLVKKALVGLAFMFVQVINTIAYALVNVVYISYYVAFMLISATGPLFLVFFLSEATTSWAQSWLTALFSHFLSLVFVVITLDLCNAIELRSNNILTGNHTGSVDISMIVPAIVNLLFVFGIIMAVPKVANSMLGVMGASGFGAGLLGAALAGGKFPGQAGRVGKGTWNGAKRTGRVALAPARGVKKIANIIRGK